MENKNNNLIETLKNNNILGSELTWDKFIGFKVEYKDDSPNKPRLVPICIGYDFSTDIIEEKNHCTQQNNNEYIHFTPRQSNSITNIEITFDISKIETSELKCFCEYTWELKHADMEFNLRKINNNSFVVDNISEFYHLNLSRCMSYRLKFIYSGNIKNIFENIKIKTTNVWWASKYFDSLGNNLDFIFPVWKIKPIEQPIKKIIDNSQYKNFYNLVNKKILENKGSIIIPDDIIEIEKEVGIKA